MNTSSLNVIEEAPALNSAGRSSVNFVIEHRVQTGHESQYEAWLKKIIPICQGFPGNCGTEVIRPHSGTVSPKYTIVVRFAGSSHLEKWIRSQERADLIREIQPILTDGDRFTVKSGLDFWFTPEEVKAKLPTRWKQALVTWSVIFPLVLVVPQALSPLFDLGGPFIYPAVRTLVVTGTVVLLVVYVVMPRYTRLVHRWLFR